MYSLVVSLISPLLYQYDEIRFLEGECLHRTRFTILLYCSACYLTDLVIVTANAFDNIGKRQQTCCYCCFIFIKQSINVVLSYQ